jgi:hypothetical protein
MLNFLSLTIYKYQNSESHDLFIYLKIILLCRSTREVEVNQITFLSPIVLLKSGEIVHNIQAELHGGGSHVSR